MISNYSHHCRKLNYLVEVNLTRVNCSYADLGICRKDNQSCSVAKRYSRILEILAENETSGKRAPTPEFLERA